MDIRGRLPATTGFAAIAILFGLAASAAAQPYPSRSVRLMVAFSAGGTLDTLARIIGQKLGDSWGQQVVVENRVGAGGNIGAAAAAQAAPDGYSLHFGAQSLAVNVTIAPTQGFDPVRDFDPVILVAAAQDVLTVPPHSPARSVQDLIAMAKARPGEIDYASAGPGSSGHLSTVLFSELAGIKLQHLPYTSQSQAILDIMSGRVTMWISTLGGHLGNIKAGKVRALAVSGPERAEQLPEVPTFKEQGIPLVEPSTWFGIFVPKGTPPEIIAKINADVGRILEEPDMRERAKALGYTLYGGAPERLGVMLRSEIAKWADIAKKTDLSRK
jgi:tripartite-type tricarboxylate transporter receptor subunit TctC